MRIDHQLAYLGMYDLPPLRLAQDAWWSGLAQHFKAQGLANVPEHLNRSIADPYDIWQTPELFFAQTCGYPLTHRLSGKVRLVGTPCYDAPGCLSALYRSLFIVHEKSGIENLSTAFPARVAVNGRDSYSGWHVLGKTISALALDDDPYTEIILSGGHANSIDLVRRGEADLAAIDCITHALIGDVEPDRLVGTRIVAQSAAAPGLPYVTRADVADTDAKLMTKAIQMAFDDPQLSDARQALRLTGFTEVTLQEYQRSMI